ncbi:MAG: hypothetical protein QM737_06530 [Ferruginibacter sp.]
MLLSVKHEREPLHKVIFSFFYDAAQSLMNLLANTFSKLFVSLLADFYSAFRNP